MRLCPRHGVVVGKLEEHELGNSVPDSAGLADEQILIRGQRAMDVGEKEK